MTETKTVEVTQADRDAVADFVTAMGYGGAIADNYRAGKSDHCFRIQAFARHRLASQSLSSPTEVERAMADVAAERRRQVTAEGWTPEHDDEHDDGELLAAALCYGQSALGEASNPPFNLDNPPGLWPWDVAWWKPVNARRDLVRAAALIVAEIERIDRAALEGKDHSHVQPEGS
ncbi:hypothetical protein [Sphingomonas koreensis]